jgi:hypothetical protein
MLGAAALAATLIPSAGIAAPPAPARPRVVVVNAVDLPESLSDIRANLRATLEGAVTRRDYDLGPDPGFCTDRECLKVAAQTAGATDVLVATGGRNSMRGYHVELRLWNVASDREDQAVAECNICAALQMVESVGTVAGQLLDRVPALHANLTAAAPSAAPAAVAAAAPEPAPAAPVLVASPAPAEAAPAGSRRWLGWTLVGAGVASGVASGILFGINGQNGDCHMDATGCIKERHTLAPAIVTAGVAAAGIASGLVILLRHDSPEHPGLSLGIQPFGLTLGGRL